MGGFSKRPVPIAGGIVSVASSDITLRTENIDGLQGKGPAGVDGFQITSQEYDQTQRALQPYVLLLQPESGTVDEVVSVFGFTEGDQVIAMTEAGVSITFRQASLGAGGNVFIDGGDRLGELTIVGPHHNVWFYVEDDGLGGYRLVEISRSFPPDAPI